jgi:hypothetical protein
MCKVGRRFQYEVQDAAIPTGELFFLLIVNRIGQTGSLLGKGKRNQPERRGLIVGELDKVDARLECFVENLLDAFYSRLGCKIVSFQISSLPCSA